MDKGGANPRDRHLPNDIKCNDKTIYLIAMPVKDPGNPRGDFTLV